MRRISVGLLSMVGLAASGRMFAKSRQAAQGKLTDSIVLEHEARLIAGIPNSGFGLAYYAAMLCTLPIADRPLVRPAIAASTIAASVMSARLAWSLTRPESRSCRICWTAHGVNALLLYTIFVPHHKNEI